MRHCAHRFAAGHRIRLALSTAYWPTVWPAAHNAKVTLNLPHCRLLLPHRPPPAYERANAAPALPPPDNAPTPYPCLRAPAQRREVVEHADGSREIILDDDMGLRRNPHHQMEIGATALQKFRIHPDDPLSARTETVWDTTLRRGEWQTRVVARHVMTCDARSFALTRTVSAYEGDELIWEKEWRDVISRDCC